MRKLTFAPFLCLLAFSPPKNVHNTKSESVTKTWPSTRMKSPFWASIVAWALFIYVPSRLNAPRSGRSQAKQPKDFDCDSSPPFHSIPPNPEFHSEVHGFFFYIFWSPLYYNRLFCAWGWWTLRAACRLQDTLILFAGRELVENTFTWCVRRLALRGKTESESECQILWVHLMDLSELLTEPQLSSHRVYFVYI